MSDLIVIEGEEDPEAARYRELREQALVRIAALGNTLSKTRDDAVTARQQSGIEDDWLEDEEFYEGIDDANRDLYRNRAKPLSPEGGSDKKPQGEVRSRVFLNITRPYVDAAAAKVADMLLPTDDQNWAIEETPIPSLVKASKDNSPLLDPNTGQQMVMQATDEQGNLIQKPMTVADQVKQIIDQAKDAAKDAERRIDDWLTESNYNSETRKLIEYAARLGTGIMKGPVPIERQKRAVIKDAAGIVSIIEEFIVAPESRAISPWNFYPDPSCGGDIHRGSFTWEKDKLTARQLRELKNDPSYIAENIDECLLEGPQKKYMDEPRSEKGLPDVNDKDLYEIWYYHGFISREDMQACGCEVDEGFEQIPAIITMVNDHVIKAAFNPNTSGAFPYDVMVWQARDDFWAGIGVGRQIRTPQRMLNASVRQLMDNAGLSAGPQLVIKKGVIEPEDGQWKITPRKIWTMSEDGEGSVQDAFAAINIQSLQADLMAITQFAMKMAEDVTGLPLLLQGQQGKAPETVGGMQMLSNNASTVLRRIARTFDDCVTEPHIRRYYDWLLEDPDVPSSEKGDFNIVARGSSALVERDIQNQTIGAMGALVQNPAFGIDPKRWIREWFKSQRLDPRLFQYTEEELKRIEEMQRQSPPEEPSVTVARIRADVEFKKAQLDSQSAAEERQFRLQMAQLERDTAMLKLAQEKDMKLADIKKELAKVAMIEKNKRDIFNAEAGIKQAYGEGL